MTFLFDADEGGFYTASEQPLPDGTIVVDGQGNTVIDGQGNTVISN